MYTITGTLISFPLEVIKSRMQMETHHKNTIDCIQNILKNEGKSALVRGIMPSLVQAFPASAIGFVVYEATMKLL
jgi:solute carrier family 25 S-adenosylmethionine transporter 26